MKLKSIYVILMELPNQINLTLKYLAVHEHDDVHIAMIQIKMDSVEIRLRYLLLTHDINLDTVLVPKHVADELRPKQ